MSKADGWRIGIASGPGKEEAPGLDSSLVIIGFLKYSTGVGTFHVNARFFPTSVKRNMGFTRAFPSHEILPKPGLPKHGIFSQMISFHRKNESCIAII